MEQRGESLTEDYLFQLPADVASNAVPLIGVTGLDIVHHATHYLLWHLLAEDRSNDADVRTPLAYIHVQPDHEFPPKKSKRSYEMGGQVSGIFKSNWFHKHLHELPAVMCHFVDLDWDNPAFEEKEIEVSSKIRTLRAALMGRGTQFCLCLIQSNPSTTTPVVPLRYSPSASGKSLPSANSSLPHQNQLDSAINERHASLARACDIPVKQIYILPLAGSPSEDGSGRISNMNGASGDAGSGGDELQKVLLHGIRRLEAMLLGVSHAYFASETKRVRAQRDNLQRVVNSSFLLIRHQIKQAFFQEMRQEPAQAVQFYRAAHLQLKDIRITPAFMHEVKTIAMILMYKICRLLLGKFDSSLNVSLQMPSSDSVNAAAPKQSSSSSSSNVRDAIDHFKAFRAHYKIYQGLPELEYEHEAWLGRQHTIFADLLARACEIQPPSGVASANSQVQQISAPSPTSATRVSKHEHPGVFYRDAATHCQRRKFLAYTAIVDCGGMAEIEKHASVPAPLQADFYGQRRVLKQVSQPPELYRYLLAQETRLNYPRLMIALLSKALLFYRHMQRSDSRRMQWMLLVMIGDEYTQVNEFELALTYLSKALNEYQQERWYDLVGRVAPGTLNCAIRSANLIEFILCSLTLQSVRLSTTIRSDYSVKVWNGLQQLLDKVDIPDGVKLLGNDAVENAWKQVLTFDQKLLPLHVRIDANTTCAPLFELDAAFAVDSCEIAADEVFKVQVAVRSLCRAAFSFHSVRVTLVSPSGANSSDIVKKHIILNGIDDAELVSFDAADAIGDNRNPKADKEKFLVCTGPVMDTAKGGNSVVKPTSHSRTFHISEVCLTHKCVSKKFILHWMWQFPDLAMAVSENSDGSKSRVVDGIDARNGEVNSSSSSANRRWRVPSSSMLLPCDSVRTCRVLPRKSKIDIKLVMPSHIDTDAAERICLCYGETISTRLSVTWAEDAEKVVKASDLRMVVSAVAADDDDGDEDAEDGIEDDNDDDESLTNSHHAAVRATSSSRASVETVRPASRSMLASPLLFADKLPESDAAVENGNTGGESSFDSFIKFHLLNSADGDEIYAAARTTTIHTREMGVFVNRPRLSEQQHLKLDVDEDDDDAPLPEATTSKPPTTNFSNKNAASRDVPMQTVRLIIRGSYMVYTAASAQQLRILFTKRIELTLCEALKPTLQLYSSLFKRPLSWRYIRTANRAGMIQPYDRLTLHLKLTNNSVPDGVNLQSFSLPHSSIPFMERGENVAFPLLIPYRGSVMLDFYADMQRAVQFYATQNPIPNEDFELGTCTMQWTHLATATLNTSVVATSSLRLPSLPVAHVELPFLISVKILGADKNKFETITAAGGSERDEARLRICELRRPLTCVYEVKSVSNRWQEFSSIALEPIANHDFLLSGAREWFKIQLAPHQLQSLAVCLVPMRSGRVNLPKLVFKRAPAAAAVLDDVDADEIDEMLRNTQNESVFIASSTSLG